MIKYIIAPSESQLWGYAWWAIVRAGWKRAHQRALGMLTIVYAIILASLTGSHTVLVLPGIGGITLATGTGAAVGLGAWFVLGTIGVATGGVGIPIGAAAMTAIGALFGAIGGAAGGFGFRQVSYSLVHPIFWTPLLVLGAYFLWGHRLKVHRERQDFNSLNLEIKGPREHQSLPIADT